MIIEKLMDVVLIVMGLFAVMRFKYCGRLAIEQRKKLNNLFPWPLRQSEESFDETAVMITQVGFLIAGILFCIFGIVKLFS